MMKYLKLHIFDPASQQGQGGAGVDPKAVKQQQGDAAGSSAQQLQQQLQLQSNGAGDNGAPLNGGVQFPPPIDQSSPSAVGGMHHSHSQRDLTAGGGASDLGGGGGHVSVADDGGSPQDGGLGDWHDDEGGHQE